MKKPWEKNRWMYLCWKETVREGCHPSFEQNLMHPLIILCYSLERALMDWEKEMICFVYICFFRIPPFFFSSSSFPPPQKYFNWVISLVPSTVTSNYFNIYYQCIMYLKFWAEFPRINKYQASHASVTYVPIWKLRVGILKVWIIFMADVDSLSWYPSTLPFSLLLHTARY